MCDIGIFLQLPENFFQCYFIGAGSKGGHLAFSHLDHLDVGAAEQHLNKIQLPDGSFDRGTAKYDSNLHSTLVAVWLIAEILGKRDDNH